MDIIMKVAVFIVGGVALIVLLGAIILHTLSFKRRASASDVKDAEGKVKKGIGKFFPWTKTWAKTPLIIAGGWGAFLFAVFMLLPNFWRWLEAHPTMLWMPLLCII